MEPICGYCHQNTAENHESWCPLHPSNKIRRNVTDMPESLTVNIALPPLMPEKPQNES